MTQQELKRISLERYLAQRRFHRINTSFPKLQLVHEEPYIFVIMDFLTQPECEALIDHLRSSKMQASATAQGQAERRTSASMFPPPKEVHWLRNRIATAINVPLEFLEPVKMTHYRQGDFFRKHSDASFLNEKMWACAARLAEVDEDGVQEALEWPSRFCTLFIYLNDVRKGGRTCFRWLDGSGLPGGKLFDQSIQALHSETDETSPPLKDENVELNIEPRAGMAVGISLLATLALASSRSGLLAPLFRESHPPLIS